MQIKTNKAIADGGASPQEEDKARMLFGSKLVVNMSCYLLYIIKLIILLTNKNGAIIWCDNNVYV